MPPITNVAKISARNAANSFSCHGRASSSAEANFTLASGRLTSAAELVSRCFATPSAQAPVWPHGSFLLTGIDSASQLAKGRNSRNFAVSLGKTSEGNIISRICAIVRNENGLSCPEFVEMSRRKQTSELMARYSCLARQFSPTPLSSSAVLYFGSSKYKTNVGKIQSFSGTIPCDPLEDSSEESSSKTEQVHVPSVGHLRFFSGACSLPHPDKLSTGGEDAHFICESSISAVGVADGVGGWADMGVDAGFYARELMKESEKALLEEFDASSDGGDPRNALKKAHSLTTSRGSSTACILVLANDKIKAANLGDSGFIVIRNGRTLIKSPPQQHDFNFPFQIGSQGCDPPEMAEEFVFPVTDGDILVVGTDGLFDNLFDSELTGVVMHSVKAGWGPQDTAERIATLAHLRAQDRQRVSPFAKAAMDAGYRYIGGKMDDITVVVSFVKARDSADVSA